MFQSSKWIIGIVSALIPIVVAVLYFLPKDIEVGDEIYILPRINALINGITFIILILALKAIKKGNKARHQQLMVSALILSVLFLISYVSYHFLAESTPYGGDGWMKTFYLIILLSHILLAIVIVPLVLITFNRALSKKFDKHRKIARITLPIWLYVTFTGVVVYMMISPYY